MIAQIMEYASLLRRWSYADLTARLKEALGWEGANPLYERARTAFPDVEEAVFTDRVSRSLYNGDFILVIAGDGIRSDVHAITEHLNQSTGLTAPLALVEFQLWQTENGKTVVMPSVPFRTKVIEHRVVTDSEGMPLTLEAERQEGESSTSRGGAQNANASREFWQRFIDTVVFDHPDQPKPRHGGVGWVRMTMPGQTGHLTARLLQAGGAEVFIRLRGENGEEVYSSILESQQSLEEQLELHLTLNEETGRDAFQAKVSVATSDKDADSQLEWLCRTANAMVNTFRPFLSQFG